LVGARGVTATVVVLKSEERYIGFGRRIRWFLSLLAFEEFERTFDVFKIVRGVVILSPQGHVAR
jgi:hypothetical protein